MIDGMERLVVRGTSHKFRVLPGLGGDLIKHRKVFIDFPLRVRPGWFKPKRLGYPARVVASPVVQPIVAHAYTDFF